MDKRKRIILIISSAVLFVSIVVIIVRMIILIPYRSGLPDIFSLQNLSPAIREQMTGAEKVTRRNPSADNLGRLGMIYHANSYYEEAVICYKLAIKRNRSKWMWYYYLGYLQQEMGEVNSSVGYFNSVIRIDPSVKMAWYYVGDGCQKMGSDFSYRAEVAFNKLVSLQNSHPDRKTTTRNDYFPLRVYAMFQLSRIYVNTGRSDLAELTLLQILGFHRSFGPAYRLLGNIHDAKGETKTGEYYLTRANDLTDYSPPIDTLIDKLALISRADLYLLKSIDEAERSLYPDWAIELTKRALTYLPDNSYLISKAVKLLLRTDFGNQALPLLENHMTMYKDDFTEIKEVADLLFEKNFYSQSLLYYYLATKLRPGDTETTLSMALCMGKSGMKDISVAVIDSVISDKRSNSSIIADAVYTLLLLAENDKARSELKELTQSAGGDAKVEKLAGMIAELDGKPQEAIRMYESSFKKNAKDLATVKYLGNVYIREKLWTRAIDHFAKALESNPNDPFILERLGSLYVSCPDISLRDYNAGKEFSERAFIHYGCPEETLIASGKSLAEAYDGLGDKENAAVFMNIAINLARSKNAPRAYIDQLENKLKKYQTN